MNPTKRQARRAGFLYLLLLLTAPLGLVVVPARIFVAGDAAATTGHLAASETLLRLGIASELVHQVVLVFLALALYRLFKPVSERLSRQLVVLGALLPVPIVFVNVLTEIAALLLVGDPELRAAFDAPERDALVYLCMQLHDAGITLASVFWGLWLIPFGLLVIRSGFIPRTIGFLLLVAGAAYVADAFTALVLPKLAGAVSQLTEPLVFFELPIIFWLVIWGARPQQALH